MNGRAPGPWEMQVQQPAPFAPTTLYQEIPHTASVQVDFESILNFSSF